MPAEAFAPGRPASRATPARASCTRSCPSGRVRCFACGHRCLIPPGHDGVCRVRFNEGGHRCRVPHGYVGALQVDPVEKKPFFHALPGSPRALLRDARLRLPLRLLLRARDRGRHLRRAAHAGLAVRGRARRCSRPATDAVAVRPEVDVMTHRGRARAVRGVFRHHYRGPMMSITLVGGTEIRATPEHEFLVTARAARGVPPPSFFVPASAITPEFDLLEPTSDGELPQAAARGHAGSSPTTGPSTTSRWRRTSTYLVHGAAVHNCQNWITSQALRDPRAMAPAARRSRRRTSCARPDGTARASSPPPTTSRSSPASGRWPSSARRAAAGLVCSYVSNGNGTPEVLDYIRPWVSLYKVDLKSFRDRHYRELGGTLDRVLWTIRALHEQGFWLEIVTLVDPRLQRLRRGADATSRGSWSRSRRTSRGTSPPSTRTTR